MQGQDTLDDQLSESLGIGDEQVSIKFVTKEEFRSIDKIPSTAVMISADPFKRQQSYEIHLPELKYFVRRQGMPTILGDGEFFYIEARDEHHQLLSLAVRPEFIWNLSTYWLNLELIQWSASHEEEILNIVFYALSDLCNYFGWSLVRIVPETGQQARRPNDCLCLLGTNQKTQLAVVAAQDALDHCEYRIRQYSVQYQKNCLWLGQKVNFRAAVYIESTKRLFKIDELILLGVGDLLSMKQTWPSAHVAKIAGSVKCKSARGQIWRRKIFLRIDNEDARMEFGNDEWESDVQSTQYDDPLAVNKPDGFKMGEHGPDAVELDLLIGTTTISFNELCNVQEGSLIEIGQHSLPMVKLNVAGETLLEGELVRLGQELMIQVTRKVG